MVKIFCKLTPVKPCAVCGIFIKAYADDKPSHKRRYCYKCSRGNRFMPRGVANPNWRGGTYINPRGYRMVKAWEHPRADKNGYVQEHILVMEKKLGRHIDYKKEEVHHKNGNPLDNRDENLEVLSKGQHARHHRIEEFKKYGVGNSRRRRFKPT